MEFQSLQFIHTLLCDIWRNHHPIHQVVGEGFMMFWLQLAHYLDRIKYIRLCHGCELVLLPVDNLFRRENVVMVTSLVVQTR